MPGSSFGTAFRITTAGESHGVGNVVIMDGCPPGIPLSVDDLKHDLARRRPGQSNIVSQRKEPDAPEILSGVFEGHTTGTPIAILIRNKDAKSKDYEALRRVYRPGHADFTYDARYGVRDHRGGGRSSARETCVRVAAGVVAKKILMSAFGGSVTGCVSQVGDIVANISDSFTEADSEKFADGSVNPVRCPDHVAARKMISKIEEVRKAQDSIGGCARIIARDIPAGLGAPVFDKLKAELAHALFSLPAVLGVEYGIGFGAAKMRGSENNDAFDMDGDRVVTTSNRHGGMLGGISTGMPIELHVVVKPTSSIPQAQPTVTSDGETTTVQTRGRHDPCLLPRFVPMAEAMVAIVLADHWLRRPLVAEPR